MIAGPLRFFLICASAALIIAALHFGQLLLMPLALAALLAFVLDPLVTALTRRGWPGGLAVALVVTLTLAILAALTALGTQQLAALSRELPTYQSTIQKKLRELRPAPDGRSAVAAASRLMAVVENEIAAAGAALKPGSPRTPTRVLVEPAPKSPLRALAGVAEALLVPLATAGLVVVLLAYLLGQRRELSDRLVRLAGGDMHRMAEALNDAARRVSRYLLAQLLVNIGYGIPLAVGLWWIGVPGAWLWGAAAALLRYVPYLGPLIAGAVPLLLAFAVDPGWSMVLWAAALVLVLELLVNQVVEPLAYGGIGGISPVAVLVSAGFWALIWGPMGLVLATPLTVCLVVLGRHVADLRFLDVLLGDAPAFDRPTLLYRRMISGDRDEAVALAAEEAARDGLREFYDATALPLLAIAARAAPQASARQRQRVLAAGSRIVEELRARHPGAESPDARVLCIGVHDAFDTLSAEMLAHALAHEGIAARSLPAAAIAARRLAALALEGVDTVLLCSCDGAEGARRLRAAGAALKRRAPRLAVVLAAWGAPVDGEEAHPGDALVATIAEAAAGFAPGEGDGAAPSAPSYPAARPQPAYAAQAAP